jgi:hypothetical protein
MNTNSNTLAAIRHLEEGEDSPEAAVAVAKEGSHLGRDI